MEPEWSDLEHVARKAAAARGISGPDQDDFVQESLLRLERAGDGIKNKKGWVVSCVMNLVRRRARTRKIFQDMLRSSTSGPT